LGQGMAIDSDQSGEWGSVPEQSGSLCSTFRKAGWTFVGIADNTTGGTPPVGAILKTPQGGLLFCDESNLSATIQAFGAAADVPRRLFKPYRKVLRNRSGIWSM
jgi:hypothetical protein